MSKFNVIKIEKAFNKSTLRERVLMFCTLFICVISISYFWIFEPNLLKQAKQQKTLDLDIQQTQKLDNEIAQLKLRLQKDPLQEINNQISFSLQTLARLDKQLDDKLVKFIDAYKMPVALSKVLSKSPGIRVSSLTTLPVVTFNASVDENVKENAVFYKHTLEIKLSGDYNAIYHYFLNLEALQEKFYWSALTYQVAQYPRGEVTIQIYTLSDQQDLVSG